MGIITRVKHYGFSKFIWVYEPERMERRRKVFFKWKRPELDSLITVTKVPKGNKISSKHWKETELEDFYKHEAKVHRIKEGDFTFGEIAGFIDKAFEKKKNKYVSSLESKDLDELEEAVSFEEKIRAVESPLPSIVKKFINRKRQEMLFEEDKKHLEKLKWCTKKKIIPTYKKIKSTKGQSEGNKIILDRYTDENGKLKKNGIPLVEKIAKDDDLKRIFDLHLTKFTLPGNTENEKINLAEASERRVTSSLEPFIANRIGSIRRDRKALRLEKDDEVYYIEGDRSLKFKVLKKGGKMEKSGNTLLLDFDEIRNMLLEIERIDALSCLNPNEIVNILKNEDINKNTIKTVEREIEKNNYDYKKIANLSIHKLYGLDPHLARKMYRQVS